jgi:coproporphyrinogen III oxidase-like Fe-S oxidoreductase
LGLGLGAWSCEPPRAGAPHGARRANLRDLAAYLGRVEAGATAEAAPPELLDAATARGEAAFLGLRTSEGLRVAPFAAEFGAAPRGFWPEEISRLVAGGLLAEASSGDLSLTARGILLADSVFARFVEDVSEAAGVGARG